MSQTTISLRVDSEDKKRFETFCSDNGMNVSAAINMFIKAVLNENRIPFNTENDTPNDTTLAAIEEARFTQIVGVLEQSHGAKITGRVQDVIELTGKAYDLNQPEQDSILNYLIQGGDLVLYGLSNAITLASQDVES